MTARPDIAAIEARLNAATEGEWSIWHDLDHQGFLTVGQASGVIPDGEAFVEGEHNPTARVYIEADASFIANAPTDIAALLEYVKTLEANA